MCYKIIFDLTCLKMSDYFIFSPVCLSVTRGHSYKLSNNRDQWSCSPSPACRRFNYDDWRQPAPTYGQSYSRLPAQPINTARNRCGRHHAYLNCPAVNASCMNCDRMGHFSIWDLRLLLTVYTASLPVLNLHRCFSYTYSSQISRGIKRFIFYDDDVQLQSAAHPTASKHWRQFTKTTIIMNLTTLAID